MKVLEEDKAHAFAREMYDKELLLLGRLKAHQDRWELVRELTKNPATATKLATLVRIHAISEEALAL